MLAQLQFLPSSLVGVVARSSYTIVCELQLKMVKTLAAKLQLRDSYVKTSCEVAAKWKLVQPKWKLFQLSENSVKQRQS